jgi:RNA recognition motif. (a.k.a. RRM, RBD, or RNP domain)
MILTLAHLISADPILQAMANGTIDWADTFTEEDELAYQEYMTVGEGAEMMASVKRAMNYSVDDSDDSDVESEKEFEEPVRVVRWANEVTVTGVVTTPLAPIPVLIPATPVAVLDDDGFQVVSKAPKAPMASMVQVNPRGIRTIVARNLPRTITDLELRKQFGAHGAIQDVYIPKNTTPGKYFGTIKGFALIKFHTHKDSTKAFLAEKDGLFLGGNAVTLEFANQDR